MTSRPKRQPVGHGLVERQDPGAVLLRIGEARGKPHDRQQAQHAPGASLGSMSHIFALARRILGPNIRNALSLACLGVRQEAVQ